MPDDTRPTTAAVVLIGAGLPSALRAWVAKALARADQKEAAHG